MKNGENDDVIFLFFFCNSLTIFFIPCFSFFFCLEYMVIGEEKWRKMMLSSLRFSDDIFRSSLFWKSIWKYLIIKGINGEK